jgi:hypothetical protein
VKLRWPVAAFLFALGAAASLVGDHSHIVTGTTEYLSDAVPFVWSSPVWFPILVAAATVSLAEVRLRLPNLRDHVTPRWGTAGVAAVVGIYVTTGLVHTAPPVPVNALVYSLAVLTWCALGDRWGALCGLTAAVVGPVVEAVVAATGLARYAAGSDALFGVPTWLPALYFAYGVVAALLAEISQRQDGRIPRLAVGRYSPDQR